MFPRLCGLLCLTAWCNAVDPVDTPITLTFNLYLSGLRFSQFMITDGYIRLHKESGDL